MTGESSNDRLPAGWEWARVDAVGEVRMGKQLSPAASAGPDQRPYLRVANVFEDRLDLRDVKRMSFTQAEFEVFRLLSGDVLLNEGQSLELVGRPAVYDGEPADVAFQNTLVRFRPEAGIASRWALTVFRHYLHAGRFSAIAKWTTSMAHLGGNRFAAMRFPIPPTREQERIVDELDLQLVRVAHAESALRRVQKTIERAKEAVLQAACEGRLVLTEAELAKTEGRAFEGGSALLERVLEERRRRWEERESARLGSATRDLGRSVRKAEYAPPIAATTTQSHPPGWVLATVEQLSMQPLTNGRSVPDADDGIPILRLTAIRGGRVNLEQTKLGRISRQEASRFLIHVDDFFVVRGNGSIKLVGRGGLVVDTPQNVVFPDTLIRISLPIAHMLPRFFSLIWDSHEVRRQIVAIAKTTAGIFKINQEGLERLVVPLPPVPEQLRIIAAIEERYAAFDRIASVVESNLVRCKRLRQSLLKSAFEGRLVPQNPDEEPASVLLSRIRAARETREAERRNCVATPAVETTSAESPSPSRAPNTAPRGRPKARQLELPGAFATPKAAKPARARTAR